MKQTFKEECIEWLSQFGYEISTASADETFFIFTDYENLNKPNIICKRDKDQKSVELKTSTNFKYFLQLISGPIQFKHPNIKNWIRIMTYYEDLVERFPPNLD